MSEIKSAAYAVYQNECKGSYRYKKRQLTRDLLYAYMTDIHNGDSFVFTLLSVKYEKPLKQQGTKLSPQHKRVLRTLHKLLIPKRHFGISLSRMVTDLSNYTRSQIKSTIPTPQIDELKKLQLQNSELQRKIGRLQKEIKQLKAELASPNDTSKSLE